jgi:hypothetical protein
MKIVSNMMTRKYKIIPALLLAASCMVLLLACEEDKVYPETRLFMPVLSEDLDAVNNTIIVNLARIKKATGYTIEISRDTFETIDYTIESDTNYVVVNEELLNGDPLFWNTLYQIRATAHAAEPEFDSKVSDLGSVRTDRFPTILNLPASYDVIDVAARVTWATENSGDPVTAIKVYAGSDLKLTTPLLEFEVSTEDQESGETFIEGLTPDTKYQVAIYSEETLRGWVDYTTLVEDISPTAPGVHDLREATDPQAVANEVAAAASGDIILVKRGAEFDMPTAALNKSITIRAAYGFGPKKARLYNTNGNWNIAGGSTIDHVRFIGLELRGGDFGGTYVFNPNSADITVGEVLFEGCDINTMRGIMRIRSNNVLFENLKIINCQVDSIGDYGILTADQDPSGTPSTTARVDNIVLQNSTFSHVRSGITSRNNSQSILIEGCTFSNVVDAESSIYLFRYRGGAGNNNVLNGVTIRNSIMAMGWNRTEAATNNIRGKDGLGETPFTVVNTYGTNDWAFIANYEIAGLPSSTYAGARSTLWVNPDGFNFNFKDTGFAGRFSAGDPRWRVKL